MLEIPITSKVIPLVMAGMIATMPLPGVSPYPLLDESEHQIILVENVPDAQSKLTFVIDKKKFVCTEILVTRHEKTSQIIPGKNGTQQITDSEMRVIEKWKNPTPEKIRNLTLWGRTKGRVLDWAEKNIQKLR